MLVGGFAGVVLLLAGVGEGAAVRGLYGARPLNESESAIIAPALTELCQFGLGSPFARFYVARRSDAAAAIAHGHRSVIVAGGVIDGIKTGELDQSEGVAVLAHAASVARSGLSRHDLAITFWSSPHVLIRKIGHPPRGLLGLAWRGRLIAFAVAIWQSLGTDSAATGYLTATVLAFVATATYTTSWCAERWDMRVAEVGDRKLVQLGLGTPMAKFLRSYPATQPLIARQQVLAPSQVQAPPVFTPTPEA